MEDPEIKNVNVREFKDYRAGHREGEYILVDVRQPREYTHGHIPGARLIPLDELEGRLGELDPGKTPVFYCRSGKRSMTAAVFSRDSGFFPGEILNLEGGILAYDGHVLPDYPRKDIFRKTGGLKDVLTRAMALEKGAFRFYEGLMDRMEDESVKLQLKRLAEMEKSHARVVFGRGKDLFSQAFEEVFQGLEENAVEGGLNTDEWLAEADRTAPEDRCLFLLELALEMENMAYDMYRSLADGDYPARIKSSFMTLAEQEKSHIRIVARLFKNCNGQAD